MKQVQAHIVRLHFFSTEPRDHQVFFFWCADRHQEKMKQVQAHIVRFRDIINKESTKLSHKFWWILRFSSTLNWVSDSLERT
jgi:hypothetical protein